MSFDLRTNNLSGVAVIDSPAGVSATSDNFITLYDYATQFQPELLSQLHLNYGTGRINEFLKYNSTEGTYASDQIEWAEQGRLHNVLKNVTVSTNTFTMPTGKKHNLRVGDKVKISDGVKNAQATVASLTSDEIFVVTNDSTVAFGFAGNVTVTDLGSSFNKGTDPFASGKRWNPTFKYNYTHIHKETYDVSESDMAHKNWVMTPSGPRWFNFEMERTGLLFDNKEELLNMFHERVITGSATQVAGGAQGCKGVIQQIEEGGNIANDYITTVQDLSDIALRIKQQGGCRELTVWADHKQMAYFRELCAGVNASFINGANYGMFNNSMDMALQLDFSSIKVDGVTFHFTPWRLLDDPTLLGSVNFDVTAPAFVAIPSGMTDVYENGKGATKGYLSMFYRADGSVNRKRKVEIFGLGGTPQKADKMTANFLTEFTNRVVGANQFFVGRKSAYYTA